MKRFHTHISVQDIPRSIEFYTHLFGQEPSVAKDDYAKWMLEDPRVNFAISSRGRRIGLDHFGFQVDGSEELPELRRRSEAASGEPVVSQPETTCCYAKSEKHWTLDPQGLAWEHFHTMDSTLHFGEDHTSGSQACCVPSLAGKASASDEGRQDHVPASSCCG